MRTKEEIQQDMENARREYRGVVSILAMMEKGTPREDLERMRKEQLVPLELEMRRLEKELAQRVSTRDSGTGDPTVRGTTA